MRISDWSSDVCSSDLSGADQPAKLPIRLWHLGVFLQKVAHQPAALWWAAHQGQLHSHIQQQREWSLRREAARYPPVMRDGWRALLAAWQQGAELGRASCRGRVWQ